jgi:hypothetical protein
VTRDDNNIILNIFEIASTKTILSESDFFRMSVYVPNPIVLTYDLNYVLLVILYYSWFI